MRAATENQQHHVIGMGGHNRRRSSTRNRKRARNSPRGNLIKLQFVSAWRQIEAKILMRIFDAEVAPFRDMFFGPRFGPSKYDMHSFFAVWFAQGNDDAF